MNERETFIRQVFETVLFFREMHEEGEGGSTGAIQLLKPVKSVGNVAVRQFVLHDLFEEQQLTLTKAAEKFAMWKPGCEKSTLFDIEDIRPELHALCVEHERPITKVTNKEEIKRRCYLRAARYIKLNWAGQVPSHSRIVELFIPENIVPHGQGLAGQEHREHVVPCVYLLIKCRELFQKGADINDVAEFLRRHVAIVNISKEQQRCLDGSQKKGGLGGRDKMPDGWQPDQDCIFQRLHDARIDFNPPQEFGPCITRGCKFSHGHD